MSWPAMAGLRAVGQLNSAIDVSAPPGRGAIIGTAWHGDNTPVSKASLRLRNVASGRIVMWTATDPAGRFVFVPVDPGVYVVELVDDESRVLGVSQAANIGPDEVVSTVVRLDSRDRWYGLFFTNSAAAVLAAAVALGVTALGDGEQPASPRN